MASLVDRVAVATIVALSVAGCVSTQQKAARIQLNDARIRAAERPTRVTRSGDAVTVLATVLIRRGRRTAFVLRLRNIGTRTVSDLPISVGARAGRRVLPFLNARASAVGTDGYFGSHLPPVAAGETIDWIYVTGRPLPRNARPLVSVGPDPTITVPRVARLPTIHAAVIGVRSDRATIDLHNLSAIPQYQLPVYATGDRAGRLVIAGDVTVPELDPGASIRLSLSLVGRSAGAALQIHVPATTFP